MSEDEHLEEEEDFLAKQINLLNRKVKTIKRSMFSIQSNSRDMNNELGKLKITSLKINHKL